ncbi:GPI transamidase component PIG-S [Peziza echinospora]|nr:GPI transamidase component PIG-S [Peziza echinospora]
MGDSAPSPISDSKPEAPLLGEKNVASLEPTPQETRTRNWVVLSLWAVVIFLGIPLWILTTSVYRAQLPVQEMDAWSEGSQCSIVYPLRVGVVGEDGGSNDVTGLVKGVQLQLEDARRGKTGGGEFKVEVLPTNKGSQNTETCSSEKEEEEDGGLAVKLKVLPGQSGSTTHTYRLHPSRKQIEILHASSYNPHNSEDVEELSTYTANLLQNVFREEEQMVTHLLAKAAASVGGNRQGTQHHGDGSDVSRKVGRMIRYSPTYHLTFSLFTGSALPLSWDIAPAIETYLAPVLEALSPISNFTIDSQIQFYASFSHTIKPQYNQELGSWTLTKDDLGNFINSAEWPLTSIKNYPTINFIIYIPEHRVTPLIVPEAKERGNAWLLPQWGGITIWNPPTPPQDPTIPPPPPVPEPLPEGEEEGQEPPVPEVVPLVGGIPPAHLTIDEIKPSLDIFAAQLLALLGTPSSDSTSLPLRISSLTRQRASEAILSASTTLGSLSRLVRALPNIAIPVTVSTSVAKTLGALDNACAELKKGRFESALREGKVADEEAEKAFFERTMVAQVYFPEEHKVAVYLPLLGPVGVPLVMGLAKILKERLRYLRQRRRV